MNRLRRSVLTSGGFLVAAMVVSNFINFAYNAVMGRNLGFNDFALITLANSIWYLFNFLTAAFGLTVSHRVAYLTARAGISEGIHFYRFLRRKVLPVIAVGMVAWILLTPFLTEFFKLESPVLILSFTPVILLSIYLTMYRGVLQGRFLFHLFGITQLAESGSKLTFALVLLRAGYPELACLSIPGSIIIGFIVAWGFTHFSVPQKLDPIKHRFHFPKGFFFASLMTGLSATAFLTLDLLLTKHYFHPNEAGVYALMSLAGKMIFFFGSLFTVFTIPFTSRDEGARRDPNRAFYYIFMFTTLLTIISTTAIGPLGPFFLPILFGDKIFAATPYLTPYVIAMGLFTLSDSIVSFHLARKQYLFPGIALFFTVVMCAGIVMFHGSIMEVVNIVLFSSIANFVILVPMHFLQRNGGFMLRNVVDFMYLFSDDKTKPTKRGGRRILIYNWRDTRHTFAGGAEVYIHELAKRWVAEGNGVTVFCGNDSKSPRREVIDGVQVVRRGGFYTVYFWAFVYYVFRFHNRFDVIIDSENGIPFFTPFYAHQQIFLLMHHVHQDVFRKNLLPPWSWLASFLEGKLMPFVYRNIQIITVSPSSRNDIIKHKLSTIEPLIVYNGIDSNRFIPAKKASKPLILYLGRLKYYKRIHIFIKAAREIRRSMPEAQFVIAGGGEDDLKLMAYAKKIGMERYITFTGKIGEADKIDLFQKAWVFVNPSSMEGWGITGIEANACGTPIIAANVQGLRDSVKDGYNGYLIDGEDEKEYARKIIEVLQNKKLMVHLSRNAIEWASRFCWERSAELGFKIITNKLKHTNRPLSVTAHVSSV